MKFLNLTTLFPEGGHINLNPRFKVSC